MDAVGASSRCLPDDMIREQNPKAEVYHATAGCRCHAFQRHIRPFAGICKASRRAVNRHLTRAMDCTSVMGVMGPQYPLLHMSDQKTKEDSMTSGDTLHHTGDKEIEEKGAKNEETLAHMNDQAGKDTIAEGTDVVDGDQAGHA